MSEKLSTPEQILKKALEKEMMARDFYAELAQHTSVDFVKELLEQLQHEEAKHVTLIRNMISRLESGKSINS